MQHVTDQRFYRSNNRILGGVCAGLAEGFHVDVLWVRVAFLLLLFVRRNHQCDPESPDSAIVLIAWPPNSLRRAAATLAAKLVSSRDAKRAKSAAEITGAGTFSAIAS